MIRHTYLMQGVSGCAATFSFTIMALCLRDGHYALAAINGLCVIINFLLVIWQANIRAQLVYLDNLQRESFGKGGFPPAPLGGSY